MTAPCETCVTPHAELSLMLPDWWALDPERWRREPGWYWPVREMVSAARYPHRRKTWLGEGHTIASFEPPRPLDPTTRLSAMMFLPCVLDDSLASPIAAEVPTVLLGLWPLHADELAYKQAYGAEALRDRLDKAGVTAVLDPDRPSCVARRVAPASRSSLLS
jgi:hypothetical protein